MGEFFGIIATFRKPEEIKRAAAQLRQSGFEAFEAYTPYPIDELAAVIHPTRKPILPSIMFIAAVVGAACGYWIQFWGEALSYPINVGGRPYNSWPAFTVSAFEIMLLTSIVAGFIGFLAASRLPMLYHPLFTAETFGRASRDRFVLCVERRDPRFDLDLLRQTFQQFGAVTIEEVYA